MEILIFFCVTFLIIVLVLLLLYRKYNDFSLRNIDIIPDKTNTKRVLYLVPNLDLETILLAGGTIIKYSMRHNVITRVVVLFHGSISDSKINKICKILNIEQIFLPKLKAKGSVGRIAKIISNEVKNFHPNLIITHCSSNRKWSENNEVIDEITKCYKKTKSFFFFLSILDSKQTKLYNFPVNGFIKPNFSVNIAPYLLKKISIIRLIEMKKSNIPIIKVLLQVKESFFKYSK